MRKLCAQNPQLKLRKLFPDVPIIHREWSEVSVKEHKAIKKIKTQNLRDHMSEAELIRSRHAQ